MKKTTRLAFLLFGFCLATPSFAQDPISAAPTPTDPADGVISLFSNAYTNVAVDTWRTDWSMADLEDVQVNGNDTKKYTNLNFVGIEAIGPNMIDASDMSTFHFDIYTPNMTTVRVKLVDFGADGAFAGGDDTEHEITFVPDLNVWNSYDIPLEDFAGLTSTGHIAQLIFSGTPAGSGTLYVDNVYFSMTEVQVDTPSIAAPMPTVDPENVISMFSNAYTNVAVNTWRTDWSSATMDEVQIAGDDTKLYTALNFVGVETVGENMIDATSMEYFHVDIWTPNMNVFRVKLVDFGADGAFAGGDDTEHELVFNPTMGEWNSYHIPLSDFTGMTSRAHIAQLIFSGTPAGAGKLYVDNVYFTTESLGVDGFESASLKMYPNPAADVVNIEGLSNIKQINVVNMLGQNVLSAKPNTVAATLDVSSLNSGVYFIQIVSEGATTTKQFIKK